MKNNITIKEIPKEERPYEKCLKYGTSALSDAELLAIIIRTGTRGVQSIELSRRVLALSKQEKNILGIHHVTITDLMRIKGIGQVKALQIKCIAELSKRISRTLSCKNLCFDSPDTIAGYYMEEMRHEEQERLILLSLDTKNKLICDETISIGTVNSSLISPRELFIIALNNGAVHIILLHNHPSGDPTPSNEDLLITKRVQESGRLLGVQLLDHIVIGDNSYVSFREQGII
jgi:DNA repair protein RadC